MHDPSDTIAAIATAPGEAGISIIRVSGARSVEIADRVFRGSGPLPSRRAPNTFVRGFIQSPADGKNGTAAIDEVILLVYRAPHSYTREDVVEIQGHGGRTSARRILATILAAGARLAEPGEFTRRAFLNGRIDLVQAEAVADLIRAHSDRAAKAAMEQLSGILSTSLTKLYDNCINVASELEATLDFSDQELPETTFKEISGRLGEVIAGCEGLLATWQEGHVLRDGARVVISGRPNVGKSSLFNALLGSDRAIVTDIPGTTRDTLEEEMLIDGFLIRLFDTAGVRPTQCRIEKEGVRRAEDSVARADVVLYMIDVSAGMEEADRVALDGLDPAETIVVLNKTDLGTRLGSDDTKPHGSVMVSVLKGTGLEAIRNQIVAHLGLQSGSEPHAAISERHRQNIQNALTDLKECSEMISHGEDDLIVPAVDCIRSACDQLGQIIGRTYSDELLDRIFTRFCIGK